MLTRTIYR